MHKWLTWLCKVVRSLSHKSFISSDVSTCHEVGLLGNKCHTTAMAPRPDVKQCQDHARISYKAVVPFIRKMVECCRKRIQKVSNIAPITTSRLPVVYEGQVSPSNNSSVCGEVQQKESLRKRTTNQPTSFKS
jgi:hypothetical protein